MKPLILNVQAQRVLALALDIALENVQHGSADGLLPPLGLKDVVVSGIGENPVDLLMVKVVGRPGLKVVQTKPVDEAFKVDTTLVRVDGRGACEAVGRSVWRWRVALGCPLS
ncbi:hypothetical protein [Streptomyces sp. NPDC020571]|uniref:hypothetical protein n=1 Tax=Streptomyces sp. NPDC020571 TaxID=3365079 RepID=UPI00379FD931